MTKEERVLYNAKVKERNRKHKEDKKAELLIGKQWYADERMKGRMSPFVIKKTASKEKIVKEKIKKPRKTEDIRAYAKEYRLMNKEKAALQKKKKRQSDPMFKLTCNIRNLIYASIKSRGALKKSRSYEILGCSYDEFKTHLEQQFTDGMHWLNQGEWHLDHIYPVSLAKDESHLLELNHYTNFQPLWAIDNFRKGNKLI